MPAARRALERGSVATTLLSQAGQAQPVVLLPALLQGTIPGSPHAYSLDSQHTFPTHKWVALCGNTAAMLGDSWLGKHFEVAGDRSTHFGAFPAGSGSACTQQQPAGGCC